MSYAPHTARYWIDWVAEYHTELTPPHTQWQAVASILQEQLDYIAELHGQVGHKTEMANTYYREKAALQRDYDAIATQLRIAEEFADWQHKVAVRMYRQLEAMGADALTLTALSVALKIEPTSSE